MAGDGMRRRSGAVAALAALLAGALACGQGGEPGGAADGAAVAGDPARGRKVYLTNCTACHHSDPTQDGTLGPAIAGSSRELIEARVVHGRYPEGYTPKRPSAQMPALPHLAPAVPDLAAYLAAPQP